MATGRKVMLACRIKFYLPTFEKLNMKKILTFMVLNLLFLGYAIAADAGGESHAVESSRADGGTVQYPFRPMESMSQRREMGSAGASHFLAGQGETGKMWA
jgi:hypothetical protein